MDSLFQYYSVESSCDILKDFINNLNIISPKEESLYYEAIWSLTKGVTFKELNTFFNWKRPSEAYKYFCNNDIIEKINSFLNDNKLYRFNTIIREMDDYPGTLKALDAPLIYYQGDISLISSPSISIVGARKSSERGKRAARIIANSLSQLGYTIVSGLAAGIDTAAQSEIVYNTNGKTIGVIGTPINSVYPHENKTLQKDIGDKHLLLSHVPFYRYSLCDYRVNRGFFPERNKLMAALSEATVIVEASNTSGSLIQAREAFRLGKKVILLKHLYDDPVLTWPKTYVKRGAFIAENVKDIKDIIGESKNV